MATADDEGKVKLRMVLPQEILLRKGWPSHVNTSFLSKKAGLPAACRPTFSRNQIIGPCYAGPGGIVARVAAERLAGGFSERCARPSCLIPGLGRAINASTDEV
jgi:hypothetical protein